MQTLGNARKSASRFFAGYFSKGTRSLLALALFALIGPGSSRTAAAQSFTVQDLDTLATSENSAAVSISNFAGVVVGNGDAAAQLGNGPTIHWSYAFWSSGAGPMNLFSVPNGYTTPYIRAINGLSNPGADLPAEAAPYGPADG